ncbi:hypothetical protein BC629DRAFT_1552081 [Irpex lacteus]|nr:hypothetical protein BC629DRAFT_1552081 [Irpex lacteus]
MAKPPSKSVHAQISTVSAMHVASASTGIARDLTDMLQIAPAAAATSILLMIFDTIEGVHTNKSECVRLARRCARFLLDLNDTMRGRWHDAPPTLTENFRKLESTLTEIHEFIQQQTTLKWHSRLLRKRELDKQIADYTAQLEDAIASFQATTLIHIHHMLSTRRESELDSRPGGSSTLERGDSDELTTLVSSTVVSCDSPVMETKKVNNSVEFNPLASMQVAESSAVKPNGDKITEIEDNSAQSPKLPSSRTRSDTEIHQPYPAVLENICIQHTEEPTATTDLPFPHLRRCHQSDLKILGRSRIKGGWWGGTVEVEFDGCTRLLKRYDGPTDTSKKIWEQDIEFLSRVTNPAFPRIGATSWDASMTPFVLIDNAVNTQSFSAFLKNQNMTSSLATFVLLAYQDLLVRAPTY